MAYTVVQTRNATGTGTSIAQTWASNTTTGNLIVVQVFAAFTAFSAPSSVTDSQGNSYSQPTAAQVISNGGIYTYIAQNITGGTTPTVTVNFSGSGQQNIVQIREYAGVVTASAVDVSGGSAGNSAAPSTTTASTTNATDLIIGSFAANLSPITFTAGAGFGNPSTATASSGTVFIQDKEVASTGAQTVNASLSQTWNWGVHGIALKLTSGGGGGGVASSPTVMLMGV